MSMSVIQNSFQVIPFQQPDTEHKAVYLHQSIIKSFNLNQSQVNRNKLNNNSIPVIQTDMLNTFNPEAFRMSPQKPTLLRQTNFQKTSLPTLRPVSQNSKVKVNFSYGFRNTISPQNFPIVRQNVFASGLNQNRNGFGMNVVSSRENNLLGQQIRNHNSLENTKNRPFSNLSELSKSKKAYLDATKNSQTDSLKPFMNFKTTQKNEDEIKTHKLGKKFRNVKFNNQNVGQKSNYVGVNNNLYGNKQKFERILENQSKNSFSLLSMQRSQYAFLPEEQAQFIELTPEPYVYSQNVIMSRPIRRQSRQSTVNIRIGVTDTSMISPIQQKSSPESEIHIRDHQQHYVINRKSPKRIDNKVYLQENQQGLQTIESKGSRLIELENINKLSRISSKGQNEYEIYTQVNDILSKEDLNELDGQKKMKSNKIGDGRQKEMQQVLVKDKKVEQDKNSDWINENKRLEQKIQILEQRLHKKQQQNKNLRQRLQNKEIQRMIEKQYQKVQMMSRLSEIEIKKLRNEIKMLQIRQKIYRNREEEKSNEIELLRSELREMRKRV